MVELYGTLHNGADWSLQSYPNYKEYRDRNTVFSGLFVYRVVVSSLTVNNSSQRVWGYLVSGNYFDVLGVKPMLGRAFLPEEDQTPDSHPVAVISYNCWQHRFGGDPQIVGKTVEFNSRPFTVIGVAPKGFIGTEVAYDPEMFIPVMMAKTIEPGSTWIDKRDSNNLFTVGRLKPGVSFAEAKAALETLTAKLAQDYPQNVGRGIRLGKPGLFIPDIANSVFAFTGVLAAVGALVILLACVNLASLLLARATERRREIAVRLAVGASRQRLVRQLLTESLLISLSGGAAGVFLAAAINSAVRGIRLPSDVTLLFDLRTDWRVLSFALLLSIATGILFSLIPALQSSKPQLVPALKDESSMAGFRRSRLRNFLVVAQISLSLILLISAGLIVRSLQAAQKMRPGFNPENAVAISFDVSLQGYNEERGRAFQRQVLERALALPQIENAALTDYLPLGLNYNDSTIYIEGTEFKGASTLPIAIPIESSPGYFDVMGIPLRGRDFRDDENKKESRVAIVNETFAKKFFNGQDPIGRRFNWHGPTGSVLRDCWRRARRKIQLVRRRSQARAVYAGLSRLQRRGYACRPHTRRSAAGVERLARRSAKARSVDFRLRSKDAEGAHGHITFPCAHGRNRARQFRCPRPDSRGGRDLRCHVARRRGTHARDRIAHGARRAALRCAEAHLETRHVARRDWFVMWATHCLRRRAHDEEPALRREHFRSDHLHVCRLALVAASRFSPAGSRRAELVASSR